MYWASEEHRFQDDSTFISLDLDVADDWEQLAQVPLAPNAVIVAIVTPDARTEDAYRQRYVGVSERLRQFVSVPNQEHPVIWVSSTAVFGQHQSGILDELVKLSLIIGEVVVFAKLSKILSGSNWRQ